MSEDQSRIDRILDILDTGDQSSNEVGEYVDTDMCGRCGLRPPIEDSEFCDGCRAWLLGDVEDPPETEDLLTWFDRQYVSSYPPYRNQHEIAESLVRQGPSYEDVSIRREPTRPQPRRWEIEGTGVVPRPGDVATMEEPVVEELYFVESALRPDHTPNIARRVVHGRVRRVHVEIRNDGITRWVAEVVEER